MTGKAFGRRNLGAEPAPCAPHNGATSSPSPELFSSGETGTVLVSRSALESARSGSDYYELVQAVIDFVNFMTNEGLYRREELVQKAMHAYHADFYLAQVNNGGHSQFIHNSKSKAAHVWLDAEHGLQTMGAAKHLDLLERMVAWAAENPVEAGQQNGFNGGRAKYLDELDETFYALENETPMIELSARWILSWPELRVVEDDEFAEAIKQSALLNPKREHRQVARRIAMFSHQLNDWLHACTGMAATAAPQTEIRLNLGNGSVREIEGEKQTAWLVVTNLGRRFAVVTDYWTKLYEYIEADNPPMPELSDTEGMMAALEDGRMANYKGPEVGRCLAHVDAAEIAKVIEYSNRYHAAAAVDLLLRKNNNISGSAEISARKMALTSENENRGELIVATETEAFFAFVFDKGAALIRPSDDKVMCLAEADEIAQHAAAFAWPGD